MGRHTIQIKSSEDTNTRSYGTSYAISTAFAEEFSVSDECLPSPVERDTLEFISGLQKLDGLLRICIRPTCVLVQKIPTANWEQTDRRIVELLQQIILNTYGEPAECIPLVLQY
jgi:hypothetical protein